MLCTSSWLVLGICCYLFFRAMAEKDDSLLALSGAQDAIDNAEVAANEGDNKKGCNKKAPKEKAAANRLRMLAPKKKPEKAAAKRVRMLAPKKKPEKAAAKRDTEQKPPANVGSGEEKTPKRARRRVSVKKELDEKEKPPAKRAARRARGSAKEEGSINAELKLDVLEGQRKEDADRSAFLAQCIDLEEAVELLQQPLHDVDNEDSLLSLVTGKPDRPSIQSTANNEVN